MSQLSHSQQQEAKNLHPRLKRVHIVLGCVFAVLLARLWYLQVNQGHKLHTYSNHNYLRPNKLLALRGLILDRYGRILVSNATGYAAAVWPQHTRHLVPISEALGDVLQRPSREVLNLIRSRKKRNRSFDSVIVQKHLNLDEIRQVHQLTPKFPSIEVSEFTYRQYALQSVGSQLWGYVGAASRAELETHNKNHPKEKHLTLNDTIGKSGLEKNWQAQLQGQSGLAFVEVNASGYLSTPFEMNKSTQFVREPMTPGHNLVLTIDKTLQQAAHEAFQLQDRFYPRTGSLVALKNTGEILAWGSFPSFDPSLFAQGISQKTWSQLRQDPLKPLRDKVIQDHYPPGSTLKPLVALAGLQEGHIRALQKIDSPGAFVYGRRTYHDHTVAGHGSINVLEAIERSSNVFFYKLGLQLGVDTLARYARAFQLGQRTGVYVPGEVTGLFPTSQWKYQRFKEKWQPGETLSQAIGQGFVLTTTLQLALLYNTIANDGKIYSPYLVHKITDSKGKMMQEFSPSLIHDLSHPLEGQAYISAQHFRTLKQALERVVHGERGTARWWKVPNVRMAGKTGTSQVRSFSKHDIYKKCMARPRSDRHHGLFVAFAPVEKPEITVAAMVEHGCHGSSAAAPVVQHVMKKYFEVTEKQALLNR